MKEVLWSLLFDMVLEVAPLGMNTSGALGPFSVKLIGENAQPRVYYPHDRYPQLVGPQLAELALDDLLAQQGDPEIVAVALCNAVMFPETGQLALAIQVETPNYSRSALVRYRPGQNGWDFSEPEFDVDLLVPGGLRWVQPVRDE